jgi:hypothetical protein
MADTASPLLPMLFPPPHVLPANLSEEEVWQLADDGYEEREQPVPDENKGNNTRAYSGQV